MRLAFLLSCVLAGLGPEPQQLLRISGSGREAVIPIAVEIGEGDIQFSHLGIGNSDSLFVWTGVEPAGDGEPSCRGCASNQLDDDLVGQ